MRDEGVLFISAKTLAERWCVTERTIRKYQELGLVRVVKIGRCVRFRVDEIRAIEDRGGFTEVDVRAAAEVAHRAGRSEPRSEAATQDNSAGPDQR